MSTFILTGTRVEKYAVRSSKARDGQSLASCRDISVVAELGQSQLRSFL